MLTVAQIRELAATVADVVELDGEPASRVEMGEMADGSGRPFALVTTYDATNDLEQTYRVALEAPASASLWAHRYAETTVEIRRGDGWLDLDHAAHSDAYEARS